MWTLPPLSSTPEPPEITTSPPVLVPSPPSIVVRPPTPEGAVLLPARIFTSPPSPVSPEPTDNAIDPDIPLHPACGAAAHRSLQHLLLQCEAPTNH
uniref:Uncharacterized protein n=1 Tax=Globisporangium ultimum (strain ATCC 200006 / CBS 805.95 / DAOM BR144) TaxID=431595 RepID=K3WJ25_GLOUD